jgi:hypothetical protein
VRYLAIDKEPYFIAYAVFDDKALVDYGFIAFSEKEENKRVEEIWHKISKLIADKKPTFVLTHLLDLRYTKKEDLEKIVAIKTLLRKLSLDYKAVYGEFRTYGWEQRITGMKKPSPKRKLDIAREYSDSIIKVEIANAIILGESVAHGRLQIGRD